MVNQSIAAPILQATATAARHFQQCAALVRRVPVGALERGQELADLRHVVRAVEADLAVGRARDATQDAMGRTEMHERRTETA